MSLFKTLLGRLFTSVKPEADPIKPAADTEPVVQDQAAEKSPIPADAEAEAAETTETLTIWTIERSRLATPHALCTEIEVLPSAAVPIHEDIMGYVFDTPSGDSVVIEAATGSLVGQSLDHVRDSVRELSRAELKQQLDTARREFNRLKKTELDNDAFWKAIRMGGADADVVQDFAE